MVKTYKLLTVVAILLVVSLGYSVVSGKTISGKLLQGSSPTLQGSDFGQETISGKSLQGSSPYLQRNIADL